MSSFNTGGSAASRGLCASSLPRKPHTRCVTSPPPPCTIWASPPFALIGSGHGLETRCAGQRVVVISWQQDDLAAIHFEGTIPTLQHKQEPTLGNDVVGNDVRRRRHEWAAVLGCDL